MKLSCGYINYLYLHFVGDLTLPSWTQTLLQINANVSSCLLDVWTGNSPYHFLQGDDVVYRLLTASKWPEKINSCRFKHVVCPSFSIPEISNPPSAPSSEKQSPMAQQHSPKIQPNTAASQPNPEPNPSVSQPNPMPHQSPVTHLPAPPPPTYTHESR